MREGLFYVRHWPLLITGHCARICALRAMAFQGLPLAAVAIPNAAAVVRIPVMGKTFGMDIGENGGVLP